MRRRVALDRRRFCFLRLMNGILQTLGRVRPEWHSAAHVSSLLRGSTMMRGVARVLVAVAVVTAVSACGDEDTQGRCEGAECVDPGDNTPGAAVGILSVDVPAGSVIVNEALDGITVKVSRIVDVDTDVTLRVNFGAVPATVRVPAGADTSAAFTYSAPATSTVDTITALIGVSAASQNISVLNPQGAPVGIAGLVLNLGTQTSVEASAPVTGTVSLTRAAATDIAVVLSEDDDVGQPVQSSIVIPAGAVSANFNYISGAVAGQGTLTATAAGLNPSTRTLEVTVAEPVISPDAGPALLISQIYGGSGGDGSTYSHDYVELYCPLEGPYSLVGVTLVYVTAEGEQRFPLPPAIVGANSALVLELARGGELGGDVPNVGGGVNLDLDQNSGALYVVRGDGTISAAFEGVVGWGSSTVAAGSPIPNAGIDGTKAYVRSTYAPSSTSDNSQDFVVAPAAPFAAPAP